MIPSSRCRVAARAGALATCWFAFAVVSTAAADPGGGAIPTIEIKTAALRPASGFFRFYPDATAGTVWLEIDRWDDEFLLVEGLSAGLGSNPVGLDRGQWGATHVVRFKRVGRRAFLIARNLGFRAARGDRAERQAVVDSFAESVLWAGDLVAQSGERGLVDAKELLVRDAHGIVNQLRETGQGAYTLDAGRSFVNLERCKSFPENVELDATLTFGSSEPGKLARETAADGGAISLRLHHSLVELPDDGYQPRVADPRVGCLAIRFADYSVPLTEPLERRWIVRHRLQKTDPQLEKSPPREPIVYYLDPGTPQPARDALLEGARWWNAAFEAAGFVNAFRVELLPPDVDPMDVRYNVIQWVHRSTRGWSYGQSIVDPRTGEIIKGHVILGSLRVRQDRLIVDGITGGAPRAGQLRCGCCGVAGGGPPASLAQFDPNLKPLDVALARLRQLSAHEVGHTLGFAHNFAASTYGDRASVMDYPAPRVAIRDGDQLDLRDAYGEGVGSWDRFTVRYAYTEYADAQAESAGLKELVDEAQREQWVYLSDADARPAGAAHPRAHLWDNGTDPVAELKHVMRVREIALRRLGAETLDADQPLADLEINLVPIFLYHRYQLAATAKLIGGFDYGFPLAGSADAAMTPVPVPQQRSALNALLATIEPEALAVPERLLWLLPPRPYSSPLDRERFPKQTAMIFDPLAAARVAAELTLDELLQPQRASRLTAYPRQDWSLQSVVDQLIASVWKRPAPVEPRLVAIQETTQRAVIDRLIALAGDSAASDGARATALDGLKQLRTELRRRLGDRGELANRAHLNAAMDEIEQFLRRPRNSAGPPSRLEPPPGSPIGQ